MSLFYSKKISRLKQLVFFTSALGCWLVSAYLVIPIARAETKIGLKVAPLQYDLELAPGQVNQGKIYLENISDQELKIKSEVEDFSQQRSGNLTFGAPGAGASGSAASWIQLQPQTMTLAPGASQLFDYTLNVPSDAALGGYYAAVFFESICPAAKEAGAGTANRPLLCVSGRSGVLFLLQVGGEADKRGELERLELPLISWDQEENLELEIKNSGNVHFKPEGKIWLKNLWGQTIQTYDIKDKTILPKTEREFEKQLVKQDLLGAYRVMGEIQDGNGGKMSFKRFIFFPPWRGTLVFLAALLAAGLIGTRLRKKIAAKQNK